MAAHSSILAWRIPARPWGRKPCSEPLPNSGCLIRRCLICLRHSLPPRPPVASMELHPPLFQPFLLLLLLLPTLPAVPETGGSWQCPRIPYAASRDFAVEYSVPSFSAGGPVQAVATYEGGREGSAVFVATRNRLHVLGPDLQPVESLATGPAGAPGCQTCEACGPGPHGPPGDTDTQVLALAMRMET